MPRAIPSKDKTGRKKSERRQAAVDPQPEDNTYSYGRLFLFLFDGQHNLMLLSVAAPSTDAYESYGSVSTHQNEAEEETEGELLTGLFLATSTPSATKSKIKKPNAPTPKPTENKNGMIH